MSRYREILARQFAAGNRTVRRNTARVIWTCLYKCRFSDVYYQTPLFNICMKCFNMPCSEFDGGLAEALQLTLSTSRLFRQSSCYESKWRYAPATAWSLWYTIRKLIWLTCTYTFVILDYPERLPIVNIWVLYQGLVFKCS